MSSWSSGETGQAVQSGHTWQTGQTSHIYNIFFSSMFFFCSSDQIFSLSQISQFDLWDLPKIAFQFHSGLEHFIDVSAMMVSAKDIRHIPPEKRNCFFPNEGQLAFYEEYSLTNCRLECAILEVQKRLGCIPWFLPKVWESCSRSHNSVRGIQ